MTDKRIENILKIISDELAKDYLDTAYGANRTLNGATFGGLHKLGNALGYDTEMNGYLSLLSPEERAQRRTIGDLVQYGGEALGTGYGLYNGLNGALNFAGWAEHQAGKRNLTNQLKRGGEFSDVNFGKINPETLEKVNDLRRQGNLSELSPRAYIPANVVKKFYDKRLNEKYTPENVADMAARLFHKKGNTVTESQYPHIQQVVRPREKTSEVGYISQNPANRKTVIKSVYKKDNKRIQDF